MANMNFVICKFGDLGKLETHVLSVTPPIPLIGIKWFFPRIFVTYSDYGLPIWDLDPNQYGGQNVHVIKSGSGDIKLVNMTNSFSSIKPAIKQRLEDQFKQKWSGNINNSSKFLKYCLSKTSNSFWHFF